MPSPEIQPVVTVPPEPEVAVAVVVAVVGVAPEVVITGVVSVDVLLDVDVLAESDPMQPTYSEAMQDSKNNRVNCFMAHPSKPPFGEIFASIELGGRGSHCRENSPHLQ